MKNIMEWTKKDEIELKQAYKSEPIQSIAERFGVSVSAVYVKARKLGARRGKQKTRLCDEKAVWLKVNYPHMANEILATVLGVSIRTLQKYAYWHDLTKSPQFLLDCRIHASKKAREKQLKNKIT